MTSGLLSAALIDSIDKDGDRQHLASLFSSTTQCVVGMSEGKQRPEVSLLHLPRQVLLVETVGSQMVDGAPLRSIVEPLLDRLRGQVSEKWSVDSTACELVSESCAGLPVD
jgi:hypothetical protein